VVELADTPDLKSGALKERAGSNPAFGTIYNLPGSEALRLE